MPSSTPPSVQPAPSLEQLPSSAVVQSTRIDIRGIQSNIVKRIGPERARKYFHHFERFLSSRLSKDEFDKLCLVALGRENLPLHNHFICSIIHNATQACGPPVINGPKMVRDFPNSGHAVGPPVWDNGVALIQNVKQDTPLSRRENALTRKSSLNHGEAIIHENGVSHFSDLKRCSQFEQSEPLIKRMRVEKEPSNLHYSVHNNGPSAFPQRENQGQDISHDSHEPLQAPLGIQLHHACFGRTQKPLSTASVTQNDATDTCIELGELSDTLSLKKRMEKMAEAEGLEGVSMECASLLNNGIDVFMKQLIGPCIELVKARSQHGKLRHAVLKQQLCRKLVNGISLQNHIPGQVGYIPVEANSISVQDLKAAMELNPRLLGANSSLLLEKINSYD
ncbi:hypothetical protein QOZ80_4AG0324370 [Eleusine coracana subsp. coracana]|nr:hypothetical protein QOZ80_4AG0324370 [Eleusine coracana subsp. coracana]